MLAIPFGFLFSLEKLLSLHSEKFFLCSIQFYGFWQIHSVLHPPPWPRHRIVLSLPNSLLSCPLPMNTTPPHTHFAIIGMLSILVVFPFLESHVNGSIYCTAFWAGILSLNKSAMRLCYCCMCRLSLLFYCQVIFHCMNIPHLYYAFTIEGYSDCSQVLTTPHAECRFLCEYTSSHFSWVNT